MKSFIEYLNEETKKPGILQSLFSRKAREPKDNQWDSRNPRKPIDWEEAEAQHKKNMEKLRNDRDSENLK